jgi:protein TonB
MPRISRNITIVTSVLLLHVLVLWAMQTGLLRRMAEVVVPAEILVEIMAAPTTQPAPAPQPQPKVQAKAPTPQPAQPAPAPVVTPQPTPAPLAIAPSAAAPAATTATPTAVAVAVAAAPAAAGTGIAVSAPPAPAKVELPSSSADYLNNPKPPYPALSKRLGEQGRVVVRVWIGIDGIASQASVKQSSNFDRLDQAAVATVLKWRYVPGKRSGVPEAMWFDVPVNWVLQ